MRAIEAQQTLTRLVLLVFSFAGLVSCGVSSKLVERADKPQLRVLPIGDSITWGTGSTDGWGWRKHLNGHLTGAGYEVEFAGSQFTPPGLKNNQHEGYRGNKIHEMAGDGSFGINSGPNIVLLHIGTNDMKRNVSLPTAPARLEQLINVILEANPTTTVILAKLIPITQNEWLGRVDDYNAAMPALVQRLVSKGHKVLLVDMRSAVTFADMNDELHPNDAGFVKMAKVWFDGILEAHRKGWISSPTKGSPRCLDKPAWKNVGEIASGVDINTDDGPFKSGWKKIGVVASGACPRSQLHFMDLDGDGLKDYACVNPDNGALTVYRNVPDAAGKSQGKWDSLGLVASGGEGRKGAGVMFADLNADGKDDYIYVDPSTGEVEAWTNGGKSPAGGWIWKGLGRIGGGVGAKPRNLQFADLNGDGRADFCLVDPDSGVVQAWLNLGSEDKPYWYELGQIATGSAQEKGQKVVLGDFTGEGRADYMFIGSKGPVKGHINRLQEKSGLVPRWEPEIVIASGPDGASQEQVKLVDLTGDGKIDYLLVDEKGQITLYENTGSGGMYQPGEGVFLCDLDGDGTSDYFWVNHKGEGYGYMNIGKGQNNSWKYLGLIASGSGFPRSKMHMAVMTKTGRADYIVVDEEAGRALWWENLGNGGGDGQWSWRDRGLLAGGGKGDIEKIWGWTFNARNVRFADLDGDGLDDYLYIGPHGAVIMWRNPGNPGSWDSPVMAARGAGTTGFNIQFADIDGDGRKDYVAIHKADGSARAWPNRGVNEDGSIRWGTERHIATGVGSSGHAIIITEMTGDKLADYVSLNPDKGSLRLWKNTCSHQASDSGSPNPFPIFIERPLVPDETKEDFNGIDWEMISRGDCSPEEAEILVKATHAASEMVAFGLEPLDHTNGMKPMEIWQTAAFNRYFGGYDDRLREWRYEANFPYFAAIFHNMNQARWAPRLGGRQAPGRQNKVTYRCSEPGLRARCLYPLEGVPDLEIDWNTTIAAYTTPGGDDDRTTIVFCPQFFRRVDHARLAKERAYKVPSMKYDSIRNLDSWERLIIHEWMHVDDWGMNPHVGDLKFDNGAKVYDEKQCYTFAHSTDRINRLTSSNADTYSWYFLYNFFHIKWKWASDGIWGTKFEVRRSINENLSDHPASQREANDSLLKIHASPMSDGFYVPDQENLYRRDTQLQLGININYKDGQLDHHMIDYVDANYTRYKKRIDLQFWSPVSEDCWLVPTCRVASSFWGTGICYCFCNSIETDYMRDPRCQGWSGSDSSLVMKFGV